MADSAGAEPHSPYTSGWFALGLGLFLAQAALGAIGGVLAHTEALQAMMHVQLAHAASQAWLPIAQLAATLALVDRVWRTGPLSWAGAVLALLPVLGLGLLHRWQWWLDWALLDLVSLAVLGPAAALGLLAIAVRDRDPGPAVHGLLLAAATAWGLALLALPRLLADDIYLHDTLFFAGSAHAAAAPALLTLIAAVGVRWRPWSALGASALVGLGTAAMVLVHVQAGMRGVPLRYPAGDGHSGWWALLGGGVLTAGLLLAAALAAWRPRRPAPA